MQFASASTHQITTFPITTASYVWNGLCDVSGMSKSNQYSEGDKVSWKWGSGKGHGKVQSKFTEKTTRKIDGSEVSRDGSEDDPAYYVKNEDGNNVLKLGSELSKDS